MRGGCRDAATAGAECGRTLLLWAGGVGAHLCGKHLGSVCWGVLLGLSLLALGLSLLALGWLGC